MSDTKENYLALSGGIGGAKLALGLSRVLDRSQLTIVANTGDDFEHFGLYISPDIDTLLYTLAGINNTELGWGRRDESWHFFDAAGELGLDTWFKLGDKDLALHIYRTNRLRQGASLTDITRELSERLGAGAEILPMTDCPVRTLVDTDRGLLAFQEYFVKLRCEPVVREIRFDGTDQAELSPVLGERLLDPALRAVIICPSNPFLSVQPILSLPGFTAQVQQRNLPVVVVSPIVQGKAIKGPTAKMMKELNLNTDTLAIAELYADVVQGIVIDTGDAYYETQLQSMGLKVLTTNIVMNTLEDRMNLAKDVIEFTHEFD